ncbi:hypothetical protein DVH05_024248 [Phytophthora capsici]|nr:hypothetical protein DVH05_024248 [Phytophthora capsici]
MLNGALSKTSSPLVHKQTLNGLESPISKGRLDRHIVPSEEEDVEAQTDRENIVKSHSGQEDSQDEKDHGDFDNQEDQGDSQDHGHADKTPESQRAQDDQGSHGNRGVPVPPATPPITPGGDRKRSRGGSLDPDGDPSDSRDDDSTSSSHHQSGVSDSNDGSSDSLSSHDSDNTLLAAQEHEDLLLTVTRASAGFLAIAEQPPTAGRAIVILGRCQRLAV